MQYTLMAQLLSQKKDFLFDEGEIDQSIINGLIGVEDECYDVLMSLPLRNPSLIQVLSILPGAFDRFLTGKYGKMFLKNMTLGGLGIWWIKDIFSAKSRCREYNRKRFLNAINDPNMVQKIISAEEKAKLALKFTKEVAPVIAKGVKEMQDSLYVR